MLLDLHESPNLKYREDPSLALCKLANKASSLSPVDAAPPSPIQQALPNDVVAAAYQPPKKIIVVVHLASFNSSQKGFRCFCIFQLQKKCHKLFEKNGVYTFFFSLDVSYHKLIDTNCFISLS